MAEQVLADVQAHQATVLIVEDNPDVQLLLQEMLTGAGHSPIIAGSGAAALDILEHEAVDLILLDLLLPDGDGYDICLHVRESGRTNLPIIMLTALAQSHNIVRGLNNADDYITKPFVPAELLVRIQKLLQRRHDTELLANENQALNKMMQLIQRDLQTAQQEVQTESLLRHELIHNVNVHLQSLCAIVDAEIRKLPPSNEREAMQRVRSRVRGAALVYEVSEALQHDPVSIGDVVRMTASALKSIYRPWKRITVAVEGEEISLPTTLAAPITMIVNELVTNCFKHAFPENRFGTIEISYGTVADRFRVSVGDDGVGFRADMGTSGHGQRTLMQLVQGLGGTIQWHSTQPGTVVETEIPLPSAT